MSGPSVPVTAAAPNAAAEEAEESRKARRQRDPEIHAMEKVLGILEDLEDHDAARRVMVWVRDRYAGPTMVMTRPGAVPVAGVSHLQPVSQGASAHPTF